MKVSMLILTLAFALGAINSVRAVPPGACTPWPGCEGGGDGSGETAAFLEVCDDTGKWNVTGSWTTSRGECSAKNTGTEQWMTTIENIDLSDMTAATLSFSYGIDNADAGEFMAVSISGDGGTSFIDVGFFEGTQSGSWRVNIVDFVPLSSQIKLRASCLTNQNMERCSWDDITVETVGRSSGPLLVAHPVPWNKFVSRGGPD